jgi:hypothetical protein
MMQVILNRAILEHLLERAATASRLLGHADEHTSATLVEAAGNTVDEIAHVLGELLGNPDIVVPSRSSVDGPCTVDVAAHGDVGMQVDGLEVGTPSGPRCSGAGAIPAGPTAATASVHAAFAAHLVGHLDDNDQPALIRQLSDHVDAIADELTELLGAPSALAEPDAAAPDECGALDGAPMLTSIAGGAP